MKVTVAGARVSAGLTQDELAKEMEVSRCVVSQWEANTRRMRTSFVYAFCHITGFSVDEIIVPDGSAKSERK